MCDGRCSYFALRIGSANVGTMKGRDEEVRERVNIWIDASKYLDFCCLQDTGQKGEGQERWVYTSSFRWVVREVFIIFIY